MWGGDTVEDGENVPLLALPPSDYHIDRCFLSNNITYPADDSKMYAVGIIFLVMMLSVNTLKNPMDTTRLLVAIKCLVMRILG